MDSGNGQVTLDVAVIGAGIAGLAAAVSLRKAHHKVTIYERSHFSNEVGAAINMPPQSTRILKQWGIALPSPENQYAPGGATKTASNKSTPGALLKQTRRVDWRTGETVSEQSFDWIEDRFGTPFVSYHRADLHSALTTLAESEGALILLGSAVEKMDCSKGTMQVSRNSSIYLVHHNILVIADGINTPFIADVIGRDVPLRRTGRRCFRTLVPTSKILADPTARLLFQHPSCSMRGHDGMSGTMNPETGVFMIAYPCRDGELMNVAIFDRLHEDTAVSDDWNVPASINEALKPIADFHTAWKALLTTADSVKMFTVSERDPLPTYVNGRAALIGDAAHAMLPVHAGGGSTALEDAAALGVLFNGIPFNDAVTINSRLMLYNALRLPRDATQQILSAVMFNPQPASSLRSRIEQFCTVKLPEVALGGWSKPTCEFLCGYDVFRETQKAVDWAEQRAWKNMERLPDGLVQHFGELQA